MTTGQSMAGAGTRSSQTRRRAILRAVWTCKRCRRGQMGGRLPGGQNNQIRLCRYCEHQQSVCEKP